jgi:hypothetical protein
VTCASCHTSGNTYEQWRTGAIGIGGTTCQQCRQGAESISPADGEAAKVYGLQARAVAGHTSLGNSDSAFRANSISLMVKAIKGGETEGRVEITLENVGAGHSVPSGSPGRQVALMLVLRNAAEDSLAGLQHEVTIGNPLGPLKARVIQRSFGITMPGDGRFEGRLYSRVDPSEPRALMTSRTWPVAIPEMDDWVHSSSMPTPNICPIALSE